MGRKRTAVIVGAGVIGVTSAYALARDGWAVWLIDPSPKPAMGASWGNGRQLSYSHTNALAAPAILRQLPRLMLGCEDAFRITPRFDFGFASWSAQFLRQCTAPAFRRNTLAVLAMAEQSRQAMERLLQRHEITFARQQCGKLVVLRSEGEMRSAQATLAMKRAAGLSQELLSREEATAVEPALAQSPDDFAGALYASGDETGDCHAFCTGLLAVLERDYGVNFESGESVSRLRQTPEGWRANLQSGGVREADLVLIANGWRANELLAPLGHRLPIEPMKGYSFTAPKGNAAPVASITDNARRIVFTDIGERILVAGIAEMGRVNGAVDTARLQSVIEAARSSLPEAADYSAVDAGWAGFRPVTPNSQPIIRMLGKGLAVNAGHGMLGWTLAMGSAERIGAVVRDAD